MDLSPLPGSPHERGSFARPFYAQHRRRARGSRLGAEYPSRGTRSRRPAMETTPDKQDLERLEAVAGNGLLDRRAFLRSGTAVAGAMMGYTFVRSAAAERLAEEPWSLAPGGISRPYEQRSPFRGKNRRTLTNPNAEPRTSHTRT